MKMKTVLLGMLIVLFAAAVVKADTDGLPSVGINFHDGGLYPVTSDGAYNCDAWRNTNSAAAGVNWWSWLTDDHGNAGISLGWGRAGQSSVYNGGSAGRELGLLKGETKMHYFSQEFWGKDMSWAGYATYDIYVYGLNGSATLDVGTATNGQTQTNDNSQLSGPAYVQGQNYMKWTGVTADAWHITADPANNCAFQVVATTSSAPAEALVAQNSTWKYLHTTNGSDPGVSATFMQPTFDDSAWPSGPAILYYNQSWVVGGTNMGQPTPDANRNADYFRMTFEVDNPVKYSDLGLQIMQDDGAVVYLNGTEINRTNMPGGAVNHFTRASGAIADDGKTWDTILGIDASLLVDGTNVLAIFLCRPTASDLDMSIDAALWALQDPNYIPLGTLVIEKYWDKLADGSIDGDPLLGGWSFGLDAPGPGGLSGVTDNEGLDMDPLLGRIRLEGLTTGDYTVTEVFQFQPGWTATYDSDGGTLGTVIATVVDVQITTVKFGNAGGGGGIIPEPAGLGLIGLALLALRKRRS